jgi:hypothetical protein
MKKMNSDIEKNSILKRKDLDERLYFSSLISEAINIGLIDTDTVSKIRVRMF